MDAAFAAVAIGSIHCENLSPNAGTSITSAKASSMAAPAVRMVSPSMPSAGPSAPSSMPIAANDAVMPAPMASGAKRLPCMAPPSTRGSSGKTQGDSVVRLPAATLKASWGSESESDRASDIAGQSAVFSAVFKPAAVVSPTLRPVSLAPCSTTKVDWVRTLNCFFKSFAVS